MSVDNEFNRRSAPRKSFLWRASVRADAYEYPCRVYDFSLKGAGLKIDGPIGRGDDVKLVIVHVGAIKGRVSWVEGDRAGIAFTADADEIEFLLGSKIKLLGLDSEA